MLNFNIVKQASTGRWLEILPVLGVNGESLTGRHVPCPCCGGLDRFRFVGDENGKWFCGQGGDTTGGDGFDLLVHAGMTKWEALRAVAAYLGIVADKTLEGKERFLEAKKGVRLGKLDELISHECHVLTQVTGNRYRDQQLASDARFKKVRPGWRAMPTEVWDREVLAAKRLMRAFGERYGL